MITSMMKTNIKSIQAMFAMMALVCISLVSFTGCSDNDELMDEVSYSWKFEEVRPSTPDFMDDKNKIESIFKAALGATGSETSVTKHGTSETCDQEVLEACQRAFDSLKDEVWQGRYVFVVTNTTTGTTICEATFDADDDNAWNPFIKTYKASDLKFGDYYYSDGTWSDGGLRRKIGSDYMEWTEQIPKPEYGKTVIGIVFYEGHNYNDLSDYTKSGIGKKRAHCYVVALTDVNNDRDDRLRWEYGPNKERDLSVGASTSMTDWNGYSNHTKIREFVNKNEGWEMKHFPAALACETYGNRTVDRDGNPTDAYDWQKPLGAPDNTSGWFLPSFGQLRHLQSNRSILEARMKIVKDNTDDSNSYKEHINEFTEGLFYWSSSEFSYYPSSAWPVDFHNGNGYAGSKSNHAFVRAILAF